MLQFKNSTKLVYKDLKNKPKKETFFNFIPKNHIGTTKAFIIGLYRKGFKTYEIAESLGISTRTVWKTIIKARYGKKLGRKKWIRRWPRYRTLTSVKIKRIQNIQKIFLNFLDWIQNSNFLDLDAILSGKPV